MVGRPSLPKGPLVYLLHQALLPEYLVHCPPNDPPGTCVTPKSHSARYSVPPSCPSPVGVCLFPFLILVVAFSACSICCGLSPIPASCPGRYPLPVAISQARASPPSPSFSIAASFPPSLPISTRFRLLAGYFLSLALCSSSVILPIRAWPRPLHRLKKGGPP